MSGTSFNLATATSRVGLGPLTTTFTPPSSCANIYLQTDPGSPNAYSQAVSCISDYATTDMSCWPPAPSPAWSSVYEYDIGFLYSPGLICPRGYSFACSATGASSGKSSPVTKSSGFGFQEPPVPGETAAGCCPSGFDCFQDVMNPVCISIIFTGSITATECGPLARPNATITVPATLPTLSQSFVLTTSSGTPMVMTEDFGTIIQVSITAPMIPMYWNASDRPPSSTVATSLGSTKTILSSLATSLGSTVIPPTAYPFSTASPALKEHLSTSAKAAIGVVVPLFVIMIAAIITGILLRRRKKRLDEARSSTATATTTTEYSKPELDASNTKEIEANRSELPANQVRHVSHELGEGAAHELEASSPVQELESPDRGSFLEHFGSV